MGLSGQEADGCQGILDRQVASGCLRAIRSRSSHLTLHINGSKKKQSEERAALFWCPSVFALLGAISFCLIFTEYFTDIVIITPSNIFGRGNNIF